MAKTNTIEIGVQDDFNWDGDNSKKFGGSYNDTELAELEKVYDGAIATVTEKEVSLESRIYYLRPNQAEDKWFQ